MEMELIRERHDLVSDRIASIPGEKNGDITTIEKCFVRMAEMITYADRILLKALDGSLKDRSVEEAVSDRDSLFYWYLPEHYEESFANPSYAVNMLGEKWGHIASFMYSEMEALISYAHKGLLYEFTIMTELFVAVYNCAQENDIQEANQTIYWFFHDYSEVFVENSIRDMVCTEDNFYADIIMNADLSKPDYLYTYGAYIGENETGIWAFLNSLSEDEIQKMADTYTEGYRIGFEVTGKDLSIKKTAQIHYPIGFERMVRAAIKNFEKMGLKPAIAGEPVSSIQNKGGAKRGAYATSFNRQYDFDHVNDRAIYFDKAFVSRRLEVLKTSFEKYKTEASVYAGPAVIEVFGETPFTPESKNEALSYDEKQQQLVVMNASQSGQITNEYIKGEERSYTIIAYPVPEIGEKFAEIFAETVKINTLDYHKYQTMQQNIIDVLDKADKVHIKGKNGNVTDLYVKIRNLEDPDKQTAFENCVADVNIPVGEVFTSPVLKGTTGTLHVSKVYLNGLQFIDLKVVFEDGMIKDYSCGNFEDPKAGREYILKHILMHHETLPMGEFAIGTNTTAYRMGKDYDIADQLPILIAEKTGPHFAVGDTCYSHAEDQAVYNPNGKEIMARDNEVSLLRKTNPEKAYFNCHTDITIPFDELDHIIAIDKNNNEYPIITNGHFVVEGTEELNIPLDN